MHAFAEDETHARPLRVEGLCVARREAGKATGKGAGAPAADILNDVGFTLAPGETAVVTGPSGAGKTTLLHALAGLLQPDGGTVAWGEEEIAGWSERRRDRWRRDTVGLVFQDFQLFPELGVIDNILLPLRFDRLRLPEGARIRAEKLAAAVGLDGRTARASALSRGEQQRVAVARALIGNPALILADEPTASLDQETGTRVIDLLLTLAAEAHASVVMVSHDPALPDRVDRVFRLEAGRLSETTRALT
nr:ABC transporter ATP-binding protein [Rhodovulum sp. PH10]